MKSEEIREIILNRERLLNCGVGIVVIFGSSVEGTSHSMSDIDVGVVFEDISYLKKDPLNTYGILYEEFTEKIGENIDIVYLHEAPLSLQFQAITEGIPLFYSSSEFFYDYKERVILLYLDFRFFEEIFDEAYRLIERKPLNI